MLKHTRTYMSDSRFIEQWCESEIQTCPFICQQMEPGTTTVNTCDAVWRLSNSRPSDSIF